MRDEIFNDCIKAKASGNKRFWPELAEKWGYPSGENMREAFRREARKRRYKSTPPPPKVKDDKSKEKDESTTYQEGNGFINIVYANTPLKTKEDVIKEYDIDMTKWKIDFFEVKPSQGYRKQREVEWDVDNGVVTHGHVRDSGKMLVVQLYNLRVKFVPRTIDDISFEEFEKVLEKKQILTPVKRKKYAPSDETLELDVTDLHFGSDANHEPEKRFLAAVDDVICRAGVRSFKKVYVALLGDVYHYDTVTKTTSAGTIVTTNGMTVYQTFDLGLTTMIDAIQRLSQIGLVEVIFIPGNHDRFSSYAMAKLLSIQFRSDANVMVDDGHRARKYRVIGDNLVGWMHGDIPKSRESNWLQVEAREEWGRTRYSEIHSGNYHSQHSKEDGGIVLRYLPGLTDIDEWHYEHGYVGSIRALVSFVWDDKKGLREMWFTNTVV